MSLLLEALKKAEKAKEEAQRRARDEQGAPKAELQIEGAADAKPVTTRAELPDIRQPLEILSDDIAPKQAQPAAAAPAAPPPRAAPAPQSAPEPRAAEGRAQAKKVFEAKIREPNPRLPFFIALGALGAFAIGTVVYFWIQLRPPASLVNANPNRPANEAQVQAPPAETKSAAAAPAPSAPATAAIPGLPGAAPAAQPGATASAPAPGSPAAPVAQAPAASGPAPAPKPPPMRAAPSAPAPGAVAAPRREVTVAQPAPQVHPRVDAAYSAYLAGDHAAARNDYQQVLREEPGNRDALLGLAALDVRAGRLEAAEATYLRLLQADPRDAHAQAGLMSLRSSRLDPVASESRVKTLLATDPSAHILHFTLGNQLAQQGRWAEAQAEYFRAYAAEPDNPDFAYNLAVSLDQLRQPKVALEYYRRAVALAEKRGASFDLSAARERVLQLGK